MIASIGARVLVVDDDLRMGKSLRAILEPLAYQVEVVEARGLELLKQAQQAATGFRPHIAIVDLRLLDRYSDDRSGLELMAELRSARCILYSSYLTAEVISEANHKYHAFECIDKPGSPQLLIDAIANAGKETCRNMREVEICWPTACPPAQVIQDLFEGKEVPVTIVEDLLCQLFPKNARLVLEPLGGEVSSASRLSRGRSVVLKVLPDELEPVVVKFAPAGIVQREQESYGDHVQGRLRGHFYAQLEDACTFWDLGGAIYSFLGLAMEKSMSSFTNFYRLETNPEVILAPLKHFFREVWGRHYQRAEASEDIVLFNAYDKSLRLRERIARLGDQEEELPLTGLPFPLINPLSWVLRHADDSRIRDAREAVTHGDLHGDNLFVTRQHSWAIDFERSGPGHTLRDFVELEVDIATRLIEMPLDDLEPFLSFAVKLVSAKSPTPLPIAESALSKEMDKALRVIVGLRRLAHRVTGYQDLREYLWGLLLDAVFVTTLVSERSPQRQRALVLGAIICERLRRGTLKWPPEEWGDLSLHPAAVDREWIREENTSKGAVFDAFLSYHRHDQAAVEKLARTLRKSGLNPWLDEWHLIPGDPWQEAIEDALDQCHSCVVFWGPEGLGSWENEEMRAALDRRVREKGYRVIPVLLPESREPAAELLPPFLRRATWVDFRTGLDDPAAIRRLIAGIRGQAPGPTEER